MADQVGTRGVEPGEERTGWGLIVALALLALVLLLSVVQSRPPAPKPAGAPADQFSAGRAREIQRDLVGDGVPHPVGSPANAKVREKILAHLRGMGYAPEVQEASSCSPSGNCARVSNVLARLPGREPGKSVLLSAHYDSVAAGPGASDDVMGVAAILEIARILKAGPPPSHGVLFLIDDGEEAGLLGARAFVTQNPAFDEVGAVVNLEARGTEGPSLMFETSGPDAWLVSRWAAGASRPFTSSLFSTIYGYLPNDTDLTLFRRRDVPGLNFAFIGAPSHYHTPLDTFENSSAATMQHQGENALAAVRGLAESNLDAPPQGKAVFFDLFHATVVQWPVGLSPVLGLVALVLTIAAAVLARRRGLTTWSAVALGLLVPLASLLAVAILAFGLQAFLATSFPIPWVAQPLPAMIAFWLLALAVSLAAVGLLGRRSSASGLWAGTWIFWSLVGLVLALLLPGASYAFLVPALVAGVCGVALGGSPGGRTAAAIVPVLVAAVLWFPTVNALYLGLGLQGLMATAVLLSLIFGALSPLVPASGRLGRRWLPMAAGAAAVLAAVGAMAAPPFSPQTPRPLILQFYQDGDSGQAYWLVRGGPPLPQPIRNAEKFDPRPSPAFPWSPATGRAFRAPAPALQVPPPELTVVEESQAEGKRHLRLRLVSRRGALIGNLVVPSEARLEALKVDGQTVALGERGSHGLPGQLVGGPWRQYTHFSVPPEGSEIEVVLGNPQPLTWYVFDRSPGLPPTGQALMDARPKVTSTLQDGDSTMVGRKVKI